MRILYLDIETAPNVAHVWGLWNQTVSLSQLRESSRVICWGAKWRGARKVMFASEFGTARDDMIREIHELMSAADVVAHYNGRRFDVPTLNREFVLQGMAPPAPFQQIDFLDTVKRRFRFPSNKLSYVAKALGIGDKVAHEGHGLWVKCLAGDPAAWRKMERYNKQDVWLLERLHDRLMPWIPGAPNARLADGSGCPICGGELRREGYAYTQLGRYQRYQCKSCGAWSRDTRRIGGTDIRGVAL